MRVAEVVDKFSGPLKEMQKNVRELSKERMRAAPRPRESQTLDSIIARAVASKPLADGPLGVSLADTASISAIQRATA